MRFLRSFLVLLPLALAVAGDNFAADPTPAQGESSKSAASTSTVPATAAASTAKPSAAATTPAASPAVPVPAVPAAPPVLPPPPAKGSQIPEEKNNCILCHGETDLWDAKQRRFFISREDLAADVHWLKGVNCHDCHGGDFTTTEKNDAHAREKGFLAKPEEKTEEILRLVMPKCISCHSKEELELRKGVHEKAGPRVNPADPMSEGTLLECAACHGKLAHKLLPVHSKQSPVFLDNQVQTCGHCHEDHLQTYITSVHGKGLYQMGLDVVPSCADCHGAHGIYRPVDKRSTLNVSKVTETCGKCHRFIAERLAASIHGVPKGGSDQADRPAPGGNSTQKPGCTSCHLGHSDAGPETAGFRTNLPNMCGNCHGKLAGRYAMSVHGELTRLGYAPAAKCSDCHGSHRILAVANPASPLAPQSRRQTCSKCHSHVVANFLAFDPHADHTDGQRYPLLHGVYTALMALMIITFGVFGVHSVLWFLRGLYDVLVEGRPAAMAPGGTAYVRFNSFHRRTHALLLTSFLGLAITGMPLKYSDAAWARHMASALGGFDSTGVWHRLFALITFGCFFTFIFGMAFQLRARRKGRKTTLLGAIFGPDSPVPNWRDLKDFGRMLRWFVGLGPRPAFERWAYWEKFDFWGAIADVLIIGTTGLILWFPNFFTSFLPGSVLNIAKVIHSTQALLATGFVFAIHFFNTHLRAEKFPADMSVLTGLVTEEEMLHERPDYYQRLRAEGKLDQLRVPTPSRWTIRFIQASGTFALLAGLALLAGMIWAMLGGGG
jgi:cytochrome b subunit of formate dehydrogenase/uncharacterized membrane protein